MAGLGALKQRLLPSGESGLDELNDLLYTREREHKTAVFQRIGGHQVAFALEWYWLTARDDRTAIRRACRESAGAYGVLLSSGGVERDESDHAVEHVVGVPAKHHHLKRCYSAAAVVSQVYNTAIIVVLLEGSQYWLLALSRNTPIVGKDMVSSSRAALRQVALELLQAYPEFQLVGDVAFWRDVVQTDRSVTEASLEELLSVERVRKSKPLNRYEHNWSSTWLRVGLVAVPLLLGGWYHQDLQDMAMRYLTDVEQREQQAAWNRQVERHNRTVVDAYNEIASNHPIDNWILRLALTIDQLRLEVRGWSLVSLSCGAQLPYCTATWFNQGVGTFQGLESAMGHAGTLDFTSPVEASQSIELPNPAGHRFDLPQVQSALDEVPTEREFQLRHISVLQAISSIPGVRAGVSLNKQTTVGAAIQPPDDVAQSQPVLKGFTYGDWSLKGEGLRLLVGSMQKLDASVFFGASMKIEFKRGTDGKYRTSWSIEGNYIVQS